MATTRSYKVERSRKLSDHLGGVAEPQVHQFTKIRTAEVFGGLPLPACIQFYAG